MQFILMCRVIEYSLTHHHPLPPRLWLFGFSPFQVLGVRNKDKLLRKEHWRCYSLPYNCSSKWFHLLHKPGIGLVIVKSWWSEQNCLTNLCPRSSARAFANCRWLQGLSHKKKNQRQFHLIHCVKLMMQYQCLNIYINIISHMFYNTGNFDGISTFYWYTSELARFRIMMMSKFLLLVIIVCLYFNFLINGLQKELRVSLHLF